MRTLPALTLGFVLLALLVGPTADQGDRRTLPAPAQAAAEPDWWVEVVATNRDIPWSLAFAPDGRLFFTERPCQLRVMHPQRGLFELQPEPVVRPSACVDVEDGLRGLALDPDFQSNHYLYVLYTYRGEDGGYLSRLSRFIEQNGQAGDERTLLEHIPDSAMHNSGRLKFGPDGKLYLATGDTLDWSLPQDLSSLAGKILRLNPDGSIPEDNPYPGSPVYSLGHRNPQGLAWHPITGRLFITEHGPSATIPAEPFTCCHDEINMVLPGGNYGWPLAVGSLGDQRFNLPVLESGTDTWAPSGADFYRSPVFPEWNGNLFFATLRGEHLHRVVLKGPDYRQVERQERLFEGQYGRLREVAQGQDGSLYFTTSNRDGRMGAQAGPDDDRILRVAFPTPEQRERRQLVEEVYLGVLGRVPDPTGLWFWFYSGLTRPALEVALQDTPEGQRVAAVRGLYIELLGRDPLGSDNAGLRSWVESPLTISEIRRAIMESAEYGDVSAGSRARAKA